MKAIHTTYTASEGFKPVSIDGKTYNPNTAKMVGIFDKNCIGTLWQAKDGEYFVSFMVARIGHFIGIPTEDELKAITTGIDK